MTPPVALDPTDRRLLIEIEADARLRTAELGRRVGLSPAAVRERLLRLEEAGAILGYRAVLDPAALGFGVTAIVRVRPAPRQLPKVAELARSLPEVVECQRITGEDCFLIELRLRSLDELEPTIDRFTLYGQTTTSLVQSWAVPRRGVPLDG